MACSHTLSAVPGTRVREVRSGATCHTAHPSACWLRAGGGQGARSMRWRLQLPPSYPQFLYHGQHAALSHTSRLQLSKGLQRGKSYGGMEPHATWVLPAVLAQNQAHVARSSIHLTLPTAAARSHGLGATHSMAPETRVGRGGSQASHCVDTAWHPHLQASKLKGDSTSPLPTPGSRHSRKA